MTLTTSSRSAPLSAEQSKAPSLDLEVQRLLSAILALPGPKMVTVWGPQEWAFFHIDETGNIGSIDETGTIGNEPFHRGLLEAMMEQGLRDIGSVTVRQNVENNIYGMFLKDGIGTFLPAKEMEATRGVSPSEQDVHFVEWPSGPSRTSRPRV